MYYKFIMREGAYSSNRTFMELKCFCGGVEYNVECVLIVPLWN